MMIMMGGDTDDRAVGVPLMVRLPRCQPQEAATSSATASGCDPAPVIRKQASTVGLPPKLMLMGGNELSPESGSAAARIGVSGSGRLAWLMPR